MLNVIMPNGIMFNFNMMTVVLVNHVKLIIQRVIMLNAVLVDHVKPIIVMLDANAKRYFAE